MGSPEKRKVVLAVLVYPEHGNEFLMLHRNAKKEDYHAGKWNGLGGKLEPDESYLQATVRELKEESGLEVTEKDLKTLGVLHFPLFKPQKNEDWLVWVLKANIKDKSKAWPKGPEGDLVWVEKNKILSLNLWDGDCHFLPYVFEDKNFYGTFWYKNQKLENYQIL